MSIVLGSVGLKNLQRFFSCKLEGWNMRKKLLLTIIFITIFSAWASSASAQSREKFPNKPIKIIIAFAPGGGEDREVRGIAPYLSKYLGTDVLIENLPGASGDLGYSKTYRAKPDGYTLLTFGIPAPVIHEKISKVQFQCDRFTHIAAWSQANNGLFVNSESWKTFSEFSEAAKSRTLSAGLSGRGSASHLSMVLFLKGLNLKVNAVPFGGGAESITALAGKHIDFVVVGTITAYPLVKAGKLRPLVILSKSKDDIYPDVPTLSDLKIDVPTASFIRGVVGPPGVPNDRLKILEQAFLKTMKDPKYQAWADNAKIKIVPLDSKEYLQATLNLLKETDKVKDLFKE
jgi:tripartite-type tricarboxylate transporter receptor subunit TctC